LAIAGVTIEIKLRSKAEISVKALVNTGFYGDIITKPEVAERIGVELKYERVRVLPNGEKARVKYGGEKSK
jgi:predicted aspartyl protease